MQSAAYIPVSYVMRAKFIGSQASLLNASRASRRIASALRSGSQLRGGTCRRRSRRCHRRVKAHPPCGCHNCMVIAWMSPAAVGGGLFWWELAIPDLNLIKQVKQAVTFRKY